MIDGNSHNSRIYNSKASPWVGVVGYNTNVKAFTTLDRVGEPDDIGGVVAFLCTDEARWKITAQRIEVSGGMNL